MIIGKAALEEYATSGNYSNDPWGQVWNVFNPSKSAIASSGGSASAVAASLAGGGAGSQTGDSLYGPARGASLVTLRGTDGLESGSGIMPLSWLTDFGGVMTRSVRDLADMLNVVTGTDPDDPTTAPADAERPADWRSVLDPNALQGKRIGYIPSVWVDPFGTTGTTDAAKAALQYLDRRGRDDRRDGHDRGRQRTRRRRRRATRPATRRRKAGCSTSTRIRSWPSRASRSAPPSTSAARRRRSAYVRAGCAAPAPSRRPPRMTADELTARRDYRVQYKANAKTWMDTAGADHQGVDAVVYPGLLSDISLNDGGGGKASFGRRDTPGAGQRHPDGRLPGRLQRPRPADQPAAAGPGVGRRQAGRHGLRVRALATKAARATSAPTTAPALKVVTETGGTVGGTVPATLSLTLGAPASFGAFTPGVDEGLRRVDDRERDLDGGRRGADVASDPGAPGQRRVHAAGAAGGDVRRRRPGPRRCPTTR